MPRQILFSSQEILKAALEIVRAEGIEALNARSLSHQLGCSTQPLFRAFSSMAEIKEGVLRLAWEEYCQKIMESARENLPPYKSTGIAYIRYAHENPQLFRLLFMRDRSQDWHDDENVSDPSTEYAVSQLMKTTGLSHENASAFHEHLWVYVHGAAVMAATRFMPYDEEALSNRLSEIFQAMKMLFEKRQG